VYACTLISPYLPLCPSLKHRSPTYFPSGVPSAISLFLSSYPTSAFVPRCLQSSFWLDQRSRISQARSSCSLEPDERERRTARAIGRTELSRCVFPKRSNAPLRAALSRIISHIYRSTSTHTRRFTWLDRSDASGSAPTSLHPVKLVFSEITCRRNLYVITSVVTSDLWHIIRQIKCEVCLIFNPLHSNVPLERIQKDCR